MAATLLVRSADDIVWRPGWRDFGKLPNLYVKVDGDNGRILKKKTQVVKHNIKPIWNYSLDLSSPPPSMTLTFRLFHDAPGPDVFLAEAKTSVTDLIAQSHPNEVVRLDMTAAEGGVLARLSVSLITITVENALQQMSEDTAKLRLELPVLDIAGAVEDVSSGSKLLDALDGILSALDNIVKVGDEIAKIHPYASAAWKILTSVYKIVKNQREVDDKVVQLFEDIATLYSFAKEADAVMKNIKPVEKTVLSITMQTMECALLIREYSGHGFLVQTTVVSAQILDTVEKLENSDILSALGRRSYKPPAHRECLPGTRSAIMRDITERLTTPSETRKIVWLSGVAGSGKSTIAMSVAEYFRGLGRLGLMSASHAMMCGSDPTLVLHTIAFGLAKVNPTIERAICAALSRDSNLVNAPIDKQFQELLLGPLESTSNTSSVHSLSSWMRLMSAPTTHVTFLSASLRTRFPNFPQRFKSSLPLARTQHFHELAQQAAVQELPLDITTEESEKDISPTLAPDWRVFDKRISCTNPSGWR
ncbi:hypothetical protein B0H13DRAFT_2442451 [Mycena leptocephala]|nr:hypothetical protein B0H13DRAFT_2442451 [Mycena leptocephala]